MGTTGRTFDLIVDVFPNSVSVSAHDILSNDMQGFATSNVNLATDYFDGVVAGPQADVGFAYWFRSKSVP